MARKRDLKESSNPDPQWVMNTGVLDFQGAGKSSPLDTKSLWGSKKIENDFGN